MDLQVHRIMIDTYDSRSRTIKTKLLAPSLPANPLKAAHRTCLKSIDLTFSRRSKLRRIFL